MPQLSKTYSCFFDSPTGRLLLVTGEQGILKISFQQVTTEDDTVCPDATHPLLVQLKKEFTAYFNGSLKNFTVPVELHGTDFRKIVWQVVTEIPYGKTVSYLELSKKLGQPDAIRAVANANAHNPLLILIPCHRVIGAGGALGGYGGNLQLKRELLRREGLEVGVSRVRGFAAARWTSGGRDSSRAPRRR